MRCHEVNGPLFVQPSFGRRASQNISPTDSEYHQHLTITFSIFNTTLVIRRQRSEIIHRLLEYRFRYSLDTSDDFTATVLSEE